MLSARVRTMVAPELAMQRSRNTRVSCQVSGDAHLPPSSRLSLTNESLYVGGRLGRGRAGLRAGLQEGY